MAWHKEEESKCGCRRRRDYTKEEEDRRMNQSSSTKGINSNLFTLELKLVTNIKSTINSITTHTKRHKFIE